MLVFTFLLMRVLPGDPAVFFASGPNAGQEEIEMIRQQMGLDKPLPEQLVRYLGDIGSRQSRPLADDGPAGARRSQSRLPASLELTFAALLLALG